MKRLKRWLRSRRKRSSRGSVNQSANQSANQPVSLNVKTSLPIVELTVIPALDDNDTVTSAIAQGLIAFSLAMAMLRNEKINVKAIKDMAAIVINVVNTMTTVPDSVKSRRICAYHVYATRQPSPVFSTSGAPSSSVSSLTARLG